MTEEGAASSRPVTLGPAIAVVVGNMVGTGVFTSLGYQLVDIQSGFVLMLLWGLGGGCGGGGRDPGAGDREGGGAGERLTRTSC